MHLKNSGLILMLFGTGRPQEDRSYTGMSRLRRFFFFRRQFRTYRLRRYMILWQEK